MDRWGLMALIGVSVGAASTAHVLRKVKEAADSSESVMDSCQRAIMELEDRLKSPVKA